MVKTFNIEELLGYFYVFTRLGGLFFFLPGFGEVYVAMRIRLVAAIVLSIALTPLVAPVLPSTSLLGPETLFFLIRETMIGITLGLLGRVMLNALQIAAALIAYQTSLSSAMLFNPTSNSQDSVFAAYLLMGATCLLFVTNSHYYIIDVFIKSYDTFPPLSPFPYSNFSDMMVKLVTHSFNFGVKLAIPFLIAGTIGNFGLGLLSRLVPQIQVYFMMMPAQVLVGILLLVVCISTILSLFIKDFFNIYQNLPGL